MSKLANAPRDHAAGERHGLVRVVCRVPTIGRGQRWLVHCDCGSLRIVHGNSLRQRPPKSHRLCKS